MNRLILSLLCVLFLNNSILAEEGISFTQTVQVENATPQDLYLKAKYWYAVNYGNANSRNVIFNEKTKQFFVRTSMYYESNAILASNLSIGDIKYNIHLELMDGGYKVTLMDFIHAQRRNQYQYQDYNSGISYGLITNDEICTTQKPKLTSKKRMINICEEMKRKIDDEVKRINFILREQMESDIDDIIPLIPNGIIYSQFIPIDNISEDKIFDRCRVWFADRYVNSKEVLHLEDKELGELYGLASFPYNNAVVGREHADGQIWYRIRLQMKKGGFQYSILNFEHQAGYIEGSTPKNYGYISTEELCYTAPDFKKVKRKVCQELKAIIDSEVNFISNSLKALDVSESQEWLPTQAKQGEVLFSEVVKVENRSKDKLYDVCKFWIFKTFDDSDRTIDIEDKEAGELYGKFFLKYKPSVLRGGGLTSEGVIWFNLRIQIKDGQYKYTISNYFHEANPLLESPVSYGPIFKEDICFYVKGLLLSKKRKRKYCNYINERIDENRIELSKSLEEAMRK